MRNPAPVLALVPTVAIALLVPVPVSVPVPALADERMPASLVMPMTGLEGGKVRECGVRAVASWGSRHVTIDITLVREGATADLVVRAYGSGSDGGIADVALEARGVPAPAFAGPPRTILFGAERRTTAASPVVTDFLQSLMLAGTTVLLVRTGQGESRIEIDGPLTHSVRAAYLNCAGDLYRPGE